MISLTVYVSVQLRYRRRERGNNGLIILFCWHCIYTRKSPTFGEMVISIDLHPLLTSKLHTRFISIKAFRIQKIGVSGVSDVWKSALIGDGPFDLKFGHEV